MNPLVRNEIYVLAPARARWVAPLMGIEVELAGRPFSIASSIKSDISAQVLSQEMVSRNASTLFNHSEFPVSVSSYSAAAINSSAVSAISTSFNSPYGLTTSRIEVEIVGLPAAKYSGVLVGLMKRVDSLRANNRSAMSQPAR